MSELLGTLTADMVIWLATQGQTNIRSPEWPLQFLGAWMVEKSARICETVAGLEGG